MQQSHEYVYRCRGVQEFECRLTCVRMQWEHWTNCALCPLLAVSCGDAGLALFTLSGLREWTYRLHTDLYKAYYFNCYSNVMSNIFFSFYKIQGLCNTAVRTKSITVSQQVDSSSKVFDLYSGGAQFEVRLDRDYSDTFSSFSWNSPDKCRKQLWNRSSPFPRISSSPNWITVLCHSTLNNSCCLYSVVK
jgi:hypothetical protein